MTTLLQISTGLDLGRFRFQQSDSGPIIQLVLIALGLLLAGAVVWFVYYWFRRRARLREIAQEREEARLRLLMSEYSVNDEDRELLAAFAESREPAHLIPLLESRGTFEDVLADFRMRHPHDPLLRKAAGVRQRLGYGFGNLRYPFDDTRMLAPGTRLRSWLPLSKRHVNFVTVVLAVREDQFLVRVPSMRGKPVPLDRFPELTFRVTRENDAEYEFTARVLGRTAQPVQAAAIAHSKDIRRLLFRSAPRIPVDVPAHFYVVRQEVAAERAHNRFKSHESQFAVEGRLKDLSIGGAMAWLQPGSTVPQDGDYFVFRMPAAQIKEDLVAEVLRSVPAEEDQLQVHLKFAGLSELNRLKLNKFLQDQQQQGATPLPDEGNSAPSAS